MSSDDAFSSSDALTFLLAKKVQEGAELSDRDWLWLYSRISLHKPPTLEEFKTEFTKILRQSVRG